MTKQEGLRFNTGKTRLGLIPPFASEQIGKILTYGAKKYTVPEQSVIGDNNWKNGLNWTGVLDSLERHLNKFKNCIDHDEETGALHIAHVAVNAMFLTEYYQIAPQKDDRWRQPMPRVALDIDEVLADFKGGFDRWFEQKLNWDTWYPSYGFHEQFKEIENNKDFWMGIDRLVDPSELKFNPVCYVTARPIPSEVTENWIEKMGFPAMPVITVGHGESKVPALKKHNVDVFIDDKYETFVEVNNEGIACYLMDQPHNKRFDVGYRRITHVNEVLALRERESTRKIEWKSEIGIDPIRAKQFTAGQNPFTGINNNPLELDEVGKFSAGSREFVEHMHKRYMTGNKQ